VSWVFGTEDGKCKKNAKRTDIGRRTDRWDTVLSLIFNYFSCTFVWTFHSVPPAPLLFYLLRCKFLLDGNLVRSSLLWDVRQCRLVVGYWRLGKSIKFIIHLQRRLVVTYFRDRDNLPVPKAKQSKKNELTAWPLKMASRGCPETSVCVL